MTITVNGQPRDMPEGTSIVELLAALDLGDRPCAVEVDGTLVRHREHATAILRDGQRVEVVTLVGGG